MVLRWIFSADSRPFRRGLDQMRTETKAFGRSITRTMAGVFGSAAVIAGFRSWFMEMDRLDKAAKKLGASVEDLQRAKLIGEQNNVSLQQLTALLVRVERRLGEAAAGSETYRKKLEALGLTQDQLSNKQPTQKLIALSAAWEQASASTQRYSNFLGLFDSEFRELIPTLEEGPATLEKKFRDVNVVTQQVVAKVVEINDQLSNMGQLVKVGFGILLQTLSLLKQNADTTLSVIRVGIRELIDLLKNGLAGAFRALNGLFTLSLDEIKAGVADMAAAVDESIRSVGRAGVEAATQTKDAWFNAFKVMRDEGDKTAKALASQKGTIFGGSPFDPSIEARGRANFTRIRMAEDAAGLGPPSQLSQRFSLADFLRSRPIPFGDEAASRPRFGALPTTTLQSIGGNIGGNGAASADPSSRLLEIGQLQLAALQRIAANTAVSDDGTPNIPEPRVP